MGASGENSSNDDVPVLPPVQSHVQTALGIGPEVPGADGSQSIRAREDSLAETEPSRRRPDPRMLRIVLGVLGVLSLIGIVGAILFLVRKSSPPPKEESPVTQYTVPSTSAVASASAAPSVDPAPVPSTLAKGFGWLTLNGPAGKVMVKGKPWGDSGAKVAVPCGHQWVGISIVNDKGKVEKTLTKPMSIYVKCGGETEAAAKPKK
jgi:hypothetical protein